jgi:RNA polymerase sigma-70 factor (ECF subfamily)
MFKEWLAANRGIVLRVSRSFARTETQATDLEQEMLIQLWNSMGAFSGYAKVSTWIYRVCLNTALMWARSTGRRERDIEPAVDLASLSAGSVSPAERVGECEVLDQLYAAIRVLPQFDRALILLMLDNLSYREIAEVTGLTENHVGVALGRAKKRLAKLMKGITDELD